MLLILVGMRGVAWCEAAWWVRYAYPPYVKDEAARWAWREAARWVRCAYPPYVKDEVPGWAGVL